MDLLHRVRALADEAAETGQLALAQALHAVVNLGGKGPAALVYVEQYQEPIVVVGPDLPAVRRSLGIDDLAEFNALNGPGGTTARVVREFRFVE
jgi:hypothetical protein